MKFTERFNNYIRNLSPADRERELERVGYYAAGHGRPRRPGRTSVQGFPAPPRHSDPFSYTESMGSSMVNEASAGIQNMASSGYAEPQSNAQPAQMPISEFRNDKKQALKSGMQRFGMSADALRNIAKTVGIRRLDSSNDLKMIQDHFDKQKPKDKGPGNRGTSTTDVFGPGRIPVGGGMMGDRDFYSDRGGDTYSPGRNFGNYGGGRYGEFYSDLPDNTGHGGGSSYSGGGYYGGGGYGRGRGSYRGPVMSPEELGIAPGQRGGRFGGGGIPVGGGMMGDRDFYSRGKNKGSGERGVSTEDVFGPGRGGRYGGGVRVQGGGADYWREQNKRIAEGKRMGVVGKDEFRRGNRGKNKGRGRRGVSTKDVFGGRRKGARDRARARNIGSAVAASGAIGAGLF